MTTTIEVEKPTKKAGHDGGNGIIDDGNGGNGGDGDGDDRGRAPEPESNATSSHTVLGMFIFIVSEFVFFVTLAAVFLLVRSNYDTWPPPGQPRLPMLVTGINSLILLASGYTMYLAWKSIKQDRRRALQKWLFVTSLLGVMFLSIQGVEWIRLLKFGLNATGNLYAATFYVIIGIHALHVFIAVIGLLFVWRRALANAYSAARHTGVVLCQMFWLFVVFIWPLLYAVVYLL